LPSLAFNIEQIIALDEIGNVEHKGNIVVRERQRFEDFALHIKNLSTCAILALISKQNVANKMK